MSRRLYAWHSEWVDQLRIVRPELRPEDARLLVSAAIGLISSTAATADGEDPRRLEDLITAMALATCGTDLD